MSDSEVTSRLELHWVPVVDTRGHTRMEAHWVDPSQPHTATPHITHAA